MSLKANTLKANIRGLREAKGIKQHQLAKSLRISQNTMSSWENDCSKARKLSQFFRLCHALSCEHTAFLGTDNHPEFNTSNETETDNYQIRDIRKQIKKPVKLFSPLASLREAQELSQENLAEIVGVNYKTIQNWESGKSAASRHNMLARLCELLDCTYKDLVIDGDDELEETHPKNMCQESV